MPALPSDAVALATVLAATPMAVVHGSLASVILLSGAFLSLLAVDRVRKHRKKVLRLEQENGALKEALRDSNLDLVSRLVERQGSRDVAREMGLGEDRFREVRLAALLMDVGLLNRPERLNSLGRMRPEGHPVTGEEVLSSVPGLKEAARWVRWHHERADGTGYPDRLRGPWMPPEAKILAVSSLYASLVIGGPHAPGLSPQESRRTLVGEMGRAVDEGVAKAFLRVLDSEGSTYASASDERFSFPAPGGTGRVPATS